MSKISKKPFIKYMRPTALIIAKCYPWPWYIYCVFIFLLLHWSRETKDIVFGLLIGAMFPCFWTVMKVDDIAKGNAVKHIVLQFIQLNAYIEDQRVAFQASTGEEDAFRLCSSTLTQQCLVSKQKAEALYSAAWILAARESVAQEFTQISLDLVAQARRIQAIAENYFAFRVSLAATAMQDQLQAAQQWVSLVNTVYPPIAADPVDEALLCLAESTATVPI
ncbi:hypothetical protein ARMSODRAFT_1022033 [Armillaria solidipes]|uniref:Uncharacterized protein n=1 Tax=Armillaria solidipes TaxID=1076256 RepID=A0A2H3BLZ3_9AGAR|nr:hypothetical protein ARMSODRAFT_1022033 [Armillaria solidipes]